MDSKGRWLDKAFIERLWRSLKWECIDLNEFETDNQAMEAIARWIHFYNWHRPHSVFSGRWPIEVHHSQDEESQSKQIRALQEQLAA